MSEASIYCTTCRRYWRPSRIARRHKRSHAPDGGPSGQCKLCRNGVDMARYYRIKADPARWSERQAQRAAYNAALYWSMTDDERHADAKRRAARMRARDLAQRLAALGVARNY